MEVMRRIGMGALGYCADYDEEVIPFELFYDNTHTATWYLFETDAPVLILDATQGLIYPYMKNYIIQDCLTASGLIPNMSAISGASGYTNVNANWAQPAYGWNQSMYNRPPSGVLGLNNFELPMASITSPSTTVFMADAAAISTTTRVMARSQNLGLPSKQCPTTASSQATFHGRHNGMGNVLFVDGHVKAIMPTYAPVSTKVPPLIKNSNLGFITPDGVYDCANTARMDLWMNAKQ